MGASTVVGGALLGPLSDRIGRRVTLTGAFVVFAALSGPVVVVCGGFHVRALAAEWRRSAGTSIRGVRSTSSSVVSVW